MARRAGTFHRHSSTGRMPPPLDLDAVWAAAAVTSTHRTAIQRRYGTRTATVLRLHPYRLVQDLPALPFPIVDAIARQVGIGKTHPTRLQAGILTVLHQATRQGHTGLPLPTVLRRATRLLDVPHPLAEAYCLRSVLAGGSSFVVEQQGQETFLTSRALRHVEERVAEAVAEHVSFPDVPLVPQAEVAATQIADALGLNPAQAAAVRSAVRHPLTVITGGPGTGKSFVCRALGQLAAQHQLPLLAGAPTGRAVQRLLDLTALPAMTLHRLLAYDPPTQTFQRTAASPLDATVIVVDEVSMVDLFLFDALLAAVRLGAHLVLLGDVDQLPSVGPGQVLADLIAADVVPVIRFTQLYRQPVGSSIATSAYAIRAGIVPPLTDASDAECRWVAVTDPQVGIQRVVELVAEELPTRLGVDPFTIQVLCPLNHGEAGTVVLNHALQQRLNPTGRQLSLDERELRLGDRVLMTQNNYRLGVFNGDAGRVVQARTRPRQVTVRMAHRDVTFVGAEVEQLTLGYAVSVHRAQGGEFPVVVIWLHDLHAPLLQRTVLYTALTRAKEHCVLVGTASALQRAVTTRQAVQRRTGLAAALRRALPRREGAPPPTL